MQPRAIHLAAALFVLTALMGCGAKESAKKDGISFPAEYRQYPAHTGDATLDLWNVINGQTLLLNTICPTDTTTGRIRRETLGHIYLDAMMRGSMKDADPDLIAWSLLVITSHKQHEYVSEFLDQVSLNDAADPSLKSTSDRSFWIGNQFGQLWIEEQVGLRREGLRLQQVLSQRQGKSFPPCTF